MTTRSEILIPALTDTTKSTHKMVIQKLFFST